VPTCDFQGETEGEARTGDDVRLGGSAALPGKKERERKSDGYPVGPSQGGKKKRSLVRAMAKTCEAAIKKKGVADGSY